MSVEKEVFALWKETSPTSAFGSGLKKYAGQLWIPSHSNIKHALARINKLEKKADPVEKKFLATMRRDLMIEEPQDPPGALLSAFFTHLIAGINEKHILSLAEQSLNFLAVQEELWERKWPIELQIFSAQECDGAKAIIETVKKKCKKKETKQALTAVQKRIDIWKQKTAHVKLKRNDFVETYPILKKKSTGLGRKKWYRAAIKDLYDYTETPEEIERIAISWIEQELPGFKKIMKKLAKRYKCEPTVEDIDKALDKHQKVPPKKLLKIIAGLRRALQILADKEWVKITPKYDVRVIETPSYLVPFLPTAAMQPFNNLTKKPFCLFFATTDPKASPSSSLPDVAQTTIHEEYGHCVNFLNSYIGVVGKPRLIEIIGSSLDTPITEGISFFRELESIRTFDRIMHRGAHDKVERALIREIEKYVPFEEFVEGVFFVVMQWRMVRFLRAVSDVRLNLEKQTFPEFIEWAHKKTGLSKKLIFDQTFHFQENPGYAPCYSVFGQRLREMQKKAIEKGFTQKEFNTFVASIGFPARSIFEKKILKKFKI